MSIAKTKVSIIGCGSVGAVLGYNLISNHICDRLLLLDLDSKRAWAEAQDMIHSQGFSNDKVEILSGTYADCGDSDIVVLTVAAPYKDGMTRLDMYDKACDIMDEIIPQVLRSGFQGIFLIVTNPVDLITRYVQKLTQFPPQRVIGTGTSLDSSRLRMLLADIMNVDPRSVNAFCMGEHGDSQMIPWSQVTVGGKSFTDILEDNPSIKDGIDFDSMLKDIAQVAYEIVRAKRATNYGIASITAQIIKAVLFDENKVMPVSVMLHGQYGFSGIYAGMPAVLYHKGIRETVDHHLTEEEQEKLKASLEILKNMGTR